MVSTLRDIGPLTFDHTEVQVADPLAHARLWVAAGARAVYYSAESGTVKIEVEGQVLELKSKPIKSPLGFVTTNMSAVERWVAERGFQVVERSNTTIWFALTDGTIWHCTLQTTVDGRLLPTANEETVELPAEDGV